VDDQVFVTFGVLNRRNSRSRRNRGVASQMANVEAQQRPRYVCDNHLCIANRKHIVPTQVAG
jgi:hypothetical protein